MRVIETVFIVTVSLSVVCIRAEAQSGSVAIGSEFINRLLDEAREKNPGLKASDSRTKAAEGQVRSVRTWEDPMASFGGSVYSDKGFSPAEEGDLAYGIEQKLPLWGKPKAARTAAKSQAEVKRAEGALREGELRRDITQALLETALSEAELRIGEQDLSFLEAIQAATQSKYRAGEASAADTLQIENELSKRKDALRTGRSRLAHGRFALNRLLNREAASAWPSLKLPPIALDVPLSQRLLNLALQNEPKLKVLEEEIKAARAGVEVVRKSRLPDISLGVEGRQYSGDGGFRSGMFTVRFPVPWVNRDKYQSDFVREKELETAAISEREEEALKVQEELHHLSVDIEASRREALLYRDEISVRSSQALKSRLSEWETGKGAFRDVLDARRSLFESDLVAARATAEEHRLLAQMLLWTGLKTLEDLTPLSKEPPLLPLHENH
jgi:outer membrane protein TolC